MGTLKIPVSLESWGNVHYNTSAWHFTERGANRGESEG